VVAAYLSGLGGRIGYVAEVPTTHHAPYNTARRALSLDRASGGLFGLALIPGEGDEVSDANAPQAPAGPAARWSEYAEVLTRLWESFPRKALVGDQGAAVVADDALISPIDHEGAAYRVAGPLDGPSSVQGRPVLVADLNAFDAIAIDHAALRAVASLADVVMVERGRVAGIDAVLTEALLDAGRSRSAVALFGRATVSASDPAAAARHAEGLLAWAADHRLDGVELAPTGDFAAVAAVLRELAPLIADTIAHPPSTLRAAFGLPEPEAVAA